MRTASDEYEKKKLHLNLTIISYCAGTALITQWFWAEVSVGTDFDILIEGIRLISR